MQSDQVLSLASKLSMLQDNLDLILLVFIDFYRWGVGSHSIVLIGLQQAYVKDVMYASQCLPVHPTSEVQMVGCLPYPVSYGKLSNEPVMQFPGALQSQVSSA